MTFLLGIQAMLGQEPPIYFRSITTARIPFLARVQARYLPASPQPSTTRSYSSGSDIGVCIDTNDLWVLGSTDCRGLPLLDRNTYHIAPLGPGSVVVPNLFEPEQSGQYKPGVTRTFADSAVNDCVVGRLV